MVAGFAEVIETEEVLVGGVDLNTDPLGYEPKKSRSFNNLQDADGS
jgi:hypothetical protein